MTPASMHRLPRSKALAAVGYDEDEQVLTVRFESGGTYAYHDVDRSVFDGLRASAHPWTEYREQILNHRYTRLEED